MKKNNLIRLLLFIPLQLLYYILFLIFWPVSAFLIICNLLIYRKSIKWLLFTLILCPFVLIPIVSFGNGIFSFINGTAFIMDVGLVRNEYFNLDPKFRCFHKSSGCLIDGTEYFTHAPNNTAILLMYNITGPMKGVYSGPYPSREKVFQLLGNAQILKVDNVEDSAFAIIKNHKRLKLDRKLLHVSEFSKLKYLVYKETCLIIGNESYAKLYDVSNYKKIAVYTNNQKNI
jgi:hypothetical protein